MHTDDSPPIPPRTQLPPGAQARLPTGASNERIAAPRAASASERACPPEQLHVCFHCAGELAYPLDWSEEGPRHWRIVLRCPECESRREGVFEQTVVERLDDELDRAASVLLGDLGA